MNKGEIFERLIIKIGVGIVISLWRRMIYTAGIVEQSEETVHFFHTKMSSTFYMVLPANLSINVPNADRYG